MVELVEVDMEPVVPEMLLLLLLLVLFTLVVVVVPRPQGGVSETAAAVDFLPRPLLPLPRPCPTWCRWWW